MYKHSPHDAGAIGGVNVRGGGHPALGRTRGQTTVNQPYAWDETDYEEDDIDDESIVSLAKDSVIKRILNMTDSQHQNVVDRSKDKGKGSNYVTNTGGQLNEMPKHTTPTRSGIAPFSKRTLYPNGFTGHIIGGDGAGPSGQAYKTTGNYRYTGTQFGTSRKPLPKHYEDNENIWHLDEIDPYDDAIKRQNKIKNYILSLENIKIKENTY